MTPTTTAVTAYNNPASYGDAALFIATVSNPDGGTVTFTDTLNGITTTLATVPLLNNTANLTVSLTFGQHIVTATYNGDANYSPSTGIVRQSIVLTTPSDLIYLPGFVLIATYDAEGDGALAPSAVAAVLSTEISGNETGNYTVPSTPVFVIYNLTNIAGVVITGNNLVDPPVDSGFINTEGLTSGSFEIPAGFTYDITLNFVAYSSVPASPPVVQPSPPVIPPIPDLTVVDTQPLPVNYASGEAPVIYSNGAGMVTKTPATATSTGPATSAGGSAHGPGNYFTASPGFGLAHLSSSAPLGDTYALAYTGGFEIPLLPSGSTIISIQFVADAVNDGTGGLSFGNPDDMTNFTDSASSGVHISYSVGTTQVELDPLIVQILESGSVGPDFGLNYNASFTATILVTYIEGGLWGVSWQNFLLARPLPSDAVITAIYPVIILSNTYFNFAHYATYGSGSNLEMNSSFVGFDGTLGYTNREFSAASVGTSLAYLSTAVVAAIIDTPNLTLIPDDIDSMSVSAVGFAVYYTSAHAEVSSQITPLPVTPLVGQGVEWALPSSATPLNTSGGTNGINFGIGAVRE